MPQLEQLLNGEQTKQKLPWKFFRKIALIQIITAVLIILVTAGVARYYLKNYITNQSIEQLEDSLQLIKQSFYYSDLNPRVWCSELSEKNDNRVTLINTLGVVMCDSKVTRSHLDNHENRPEFIEALNKGKGSSVRYSDTMKDQRIYSAIRLRNASNQEYILRLSFPLAKLHEAVAKLDMIIILFLLPVLIAIAVISLYGSLKASTPLQKILSKISTTDKDINENSHYDDEWELISKTIDSTQWDRNRLSFKLNREYVIKTSLLESISESILAVRHDGKILFANKHFIKNFLPVEHLGMGPDELRKNSLQDYFNHEDINMLINESIEKKSTNHLNSTLLQIKGKKHDAYFDITVSPISISEDNIYGVVCVFREVTDRILTEQMRENFVANVSHEVRTPLTAMKGYVQTLKQFGIQNEELANECMSKIEHNSDRLTHLFSDILNLSVIESKGKIDKSDIPLPEITEQVISNVRQSYREKEVTIDTHYEADSIFANSALLEQVLTNLVENAYKYIGDSGEIKISWTQKVDDQFRYIILKISDNGPGIEKKHHERLFERFYRVDEARDRKSGGTGLGLSIVKHIVGKHKGDITVESEIGKGTSFTATFPQYLS